MKAKIALTLLITTICILTPLLITQKQKMPEVVEKPVYIEKVIEVEKIVEKPIEVVTEVEKVVEKPIEIREFGSLGELEEFVAEYLETKPSLGLVADSNGKIYFNSVCDFRALDFQEYALHHGFLMSIQINDKGKQLHMINSTPIGNEIYYIDIGLEEIWVGAYRNPI